MVIGIDVDGVLRDFPDALFKAVRKYHPEYIPSDFTEITEWDLENNFNCSREELRQIYWYDHSDEVMGNGNPIYGAIEQMYDLFEWGEKEGHSLVCVTSQRKHAREHTLSWLGKYGLSFDTVYFRRGRYKWEVPVDYLVDDSPANWYFWKKGRGVEEGYILMDRIYNQKIKSTCRIKELSEVKGIITRNHNTDVTDKQLCLTKSDKSDFEFSPLTSSCLSG
jgi:uncharacterized HAD superfamily protein